MAEREDGTAALRRRRRRPDEPHRVDLARRVGSRLPGRDVRRAGRGVHRADPRVARRSVDVLLIETIFDTLNAKAAIHAISELADEARHGRADHDLGHDHRPIGPRCSPGRRRPRSGTPFATPSRSRSASTARSARSEMRAHIADVGRYADTLVCAYPNAGLPNEFGYYDETPEFMAGLLGEFADAGLVNIVGGCCGTTPEHIRAIADAVAGKPPRRVPEPDRGCTSPVSSRSRSRDDIPFVNVGERTNVTGSAKFPQADHGRRLQRRPRRRPRPGRERRPDHRRQHGRGTARLRGGDGDVPQPDRRRARHLARADHDRLVEVLGDRGRPEVRPGQGGRQLDLDEGGRGGVHPPGPDRARATARRWS